MLGAYRINPSYSCLIQLQGMGWERMEMVKVVKTFNRARILFDDTAE